MTNKRPTPSLRALQCGAVASRVLREGACGRVRGVFARAFYVELSGGWICVGSEEIGAGPLNLNCSGWPRHILVRSLVHVDEPVMLADGIIQIGNSTAIGLADAEHWVPSPVGAWTEDSLATGLGMIRDAVAGRLPADGLSPLLADPKPRQLSIVMAAAEEPILYLTKLLEFSPKGDTLPVDILRMLPLVGLGPGLTPSGDDFIAGVLITLSAVGRTVLRNCIWRALQPALDGRTNAISGAHLAAAAEGMGSAALH
jgi:hypothetical protein